MPFPDVFDTAAGGTSGGSGVVDEPNNVAIFDEEDEVALGPDEDELLVEAGLDDSEDEQLIVLVERSRSGGNREALSALSALAQQMSRYKTLSQAEQEDRLLLYQNGLVAQQKLAQGRLRGGSLVAAERAVRLGEEAQTELIASMFRLVQLMAREQASARFGREKALDLLPDLVAEANVYLVEALTRYDPARCPTFSIWAARVVRFQLRATLQQGHRGASAAWMRIRRLYTVHKPRLEARLGRNPTEVEIQAELRSVCMQWAANHLTPAQMELPAAEQVSQMEQKLRKQGMFGAISRLSEVLLATAPVSSLDSPLGEEGGATLGDLLPNAGGDSEFDAVEQAELRGALLESLASLTEREREIILYRFGFADGEVWTYAKLAPMYNISAERIRQIERNALNRLRSPAFETLGFHLSSRADDDGDDSAPPRRRRK